MLTHRLLTFACAGLLLPAALLYSRIVSDTARPVHALPASQTIVAVGDSITYGLHDEAGKGGWVGRLADMVHVLYPNQHYATINAGINGDTSAGVLKRLATDVIARKPNLVIIAIGTNDFDYHVPVATFQANLRLIIQRIQAQTKAAILVQSFLPEVRVTDDVLKRESAYNAAIPAVCRQLHVGYADLFNTFLALGRSAMSNLRHDSEHPTAAGYRFIAAETLAVLESGYLSSQGTLVQSTYAPGTDDLLPDDELN